MNYPANPQLERQLDPRTGTWTTVIEGQREATAPLLAKVLGITALGFLVTAVGVATSPAWSMLPGFIAVLALIFAINMTRRKSPGMALGLFMLLAYFMGWEIGPLIHMYIRAVGIGLVFNAAVTTGLGMGCMGIVAYLFNINYRKLTGIGLAALLGVLLLGIVSIFFHFLQPDTYSWLILGVFTLLTVGDFARIRAGGDGQSATVLALSIYLDAINIFLAVLQLMGGRRRN
jgi:modulator of FtsH protease